MGRSTRTSGAFSESEKYVSRRRRRCDRSPVFAPRREVAIQRGLKKRVEQLQEARARREQAAAAEDAAFSEAFLNMARQIFDMMDVDSSGSLDRGEIMKAVKSNKEVIAFLVNCGNKYLQDLLVPARLEATLDELDADLDGEISAPEWC